MESGQSFNVYVTVKRANDGPDRAVPVDVTLTSSHSGTKTWTVDLGRGEEKELVSKQTINSEGKVTYTAEAWPQGVEDCRPGNNRGSESIYVDAPPNQPPAVKDPGTFSRIIS